MSKLLVMSYRDSKDSIPKDSSTCLLRQAGIRAIGNQCHVASATSQGNKTMCCVNATFVC